MRGRTGFALLLTVFMLNACSARFKISEAPISFSPNRIALTQQYISERYGIAARDITITPRIIVLHWTAIADFAGSFRAFDAEALPNSRPELANAGQVNVSIQFLIDRDGKVYRLMPETWMARHCIGLNYEALGIENVGGQNGEDNLTEAQLRANVRLVYYLVKKYPTIQYLIGHHEYTQFEGHPLWREKDASYRTAKTDPGARFMKAVRAAVQELQLKTPEDIEKEKNKEP